MRITDHEKKVVCIMGSTMVKTNGIYTSIIELKTWQFFLAPSKNKADLHVLVDVEELPLFSLLLCGHGGHVVVDVRAVI
jgi:hypothetical protein